MPTIILLVLIIVIIVGLVALSNRLLHSRLNRDDVLVMSYWGELWIATEDEYEHPVTLANCGIAVNGEEFESPLLLSPNHEYVAYVTRLEGATFNHVRLSDGTSLAERLIGPQPEHSDRQGEGYIHSWPSWSPDGGRLTWLVHSTAEAASFLVVCEVETGEVTTLIPQMPSPCNVGGVLVAWGRAGIVVHRTVREGGKQVEELLLYDLNGKLKLAFVAPQSPLADFFWVEEGSKEKLAVLGRDGHVDLLDVGTAVWKRMQGELEMVGAKRNGLRVRYSPVGPRWEVVMGGGKRVRLDYQGWRLHQGIAIAPSGLMVAFVTDRVYVWEGGRLEAVGLPYRDEVDVRASLVWTAARWRVV